MWNMRWRLRFGTLSIFLTLLLLYHRKRIKGSSEGRVGSDGSTSTSSLHVFTVLCWEKGQGLNHKKVLLLQIETLIKTIVLFSSRPVTIHIVNNDEEIFREIGSDFLRNHVATNDTRTFEELALSFAPVSNKWKPFRLVSVKVRYPEGLEEMVHGFKLCATARLFLQDFLPHVDAGIFLDNDIVVMDDLADLWDRFEIFTTETAMAMAPVEAHYGVRMRQPIPYFGPPGLGLNAGVALLNLTRLRDMWGGGFTEAVRFLWEKHRNSLSLADQDLLNILGSQSPWLLQPLPCEWHFHTWSCSTEIYESRFISRMRDGLNQCGNAAKHGVSLLHGNCQAFTTIPSKDGKKPPNPRQPCQGDAVLRAVFTFWAEQDADRWEWESSVKALEDKIESAVEGDISSGSCARVPEIAQMLTARLWAQKVKQL